MTYAIPHMPSIDRLLRRAVDQRDRFGAPLPTRALSPLRTAAATVAVESRQERAALLTSRIAAGDGAARDDLAVLAEEALAEMRTSVRTAAMIKHPIQRLLAATDARWADCDTTELLDDPDLDPEVRTSIMTTLDHFNDVLGSYTRFFDMLLPLARPTGTTRVLDLAAGHGGFPLAATREARKRGLDFHFTASDLKREYLDMGQEIADRENLPVDFIVQDALDLSNIDPDSYDIIVCTQSLHHFPAGLITVMFDAATRAATRGVVFADACRSALSGGLIAVTGTLRMRNAAFVHDGWVSMRRAFVPEELELLARMARDDGELESRWVPPAHCLLRWRPAQK